MLQMGENTRCTGEPYVTNNESVPFFTQGMYSLPCIRSSAPVTQSRIPVRVWLAGTASLGSPKDVGYLVNSVEVPRKHEQVIREAVQVGDYRPEVVRCTTCLI